MALNLAPLYHGCLSLLQRLELALSGFIALDVFRIVADDQCSEMALPKGSCWMANQTQTSLQAVSLSVVALAVSKDPQLSLWQFGHARLTEVTIEETFGHLRIQSRNAQLSTRGFFQADARLNLRNGRVLNKEKPADKMVQESPVSDQELPDFNLVYFVTLTKIVFNAIGFVY